MQEEREMIYSKRVRAGKRTYFFDVKATRANDYFLTLTESRRQQRGEDVFFQKSKMFVYKEDLSKFVDALQDTVNHIKTELLPDYDFEQYNNEYNPEEAQKVVKPMEEKSAPEEVSEIGDTEAQEKSSNDDFSSSELKWE